jgi:hypothetical protein
MSFNTPILFLVFNRPDTTRQVFERIKAQRPKYLYIAADGARPGKPDEMRLTKEVRTIATNIDWDCEVITLFRTENLGCGRAVREAITWFFENVDMGIILEDDCLPTNDFFAYCEQMLRKYSNDSSIAVINGCNFGFQQPCNSYFASRYMNSWGWASWSRTALQIDYSMTRWPSVSTLYFLRRRLRGNLLEFDLDWYKYWFDLFNSVYKGTLDTWDYQWQFFILFNKKKVLVPPKNLVVNIGFQKDATHTTLENHPAALLKPAKIDLLALNDYSDKSVKKYNIIYEQTAVKQVWHMYIRKPGIFYIKNYINTSWCVQLAKKFLKHIGR